MRITNNMMSATFLNGLNKTLIRENTLQEQMADGKAVHRPSDEPVKVSRSLSLKNNLALNEQYTQNAKTATSWMDTTDSAMSDLSSAMIEAQTLVTSADGTRTPSDLHTIGTQLDGLINSIIQIGNSQMGDRYLFAGQKDKTQPFQRQTLIDPNTNQQLDVVVYHGDNNKISMPVKNGVVNPSQDSVNLTGIDVFGQGPTIGGQTTVQVLNDLLKIKNEFMKTLPVTQSNTSGGAATVSGTYTGSGYADLTVRILTTTAGQVTTAAFSQDGGASWNPATPDASIPPVFTLGTTGIMTRIATAPANAANDTYAFHVPQAGGTPDVSWLSNVGLAKVQAGHDTTLKAQTELGARNSAYRMMTNLLADSNTALTTDLSANEDVDMAKAITDLKTAEAAYNAALAVGAKIMPVSLVDFMR